MSLSADREESMVAPPFEIDEWNRPEEEYSRPPVERQPFRAIVKQLIRRKKRLRRVEQMRKDLLHLHKMGVYIQDIREDNYLDGKLVDFSMSLTAPHTMLDPGIRNQRTIDSDIRGDLLDFDRMLEEAGIRTRIKAYLKPDQTDSENIGRLRATVKEPIRYGC